MIDLAHSTPPERLILLYFFANRRSHPLEKWGATPLHLPWGSATVGSACLAFFACPRILENSLKFFISWEFSFLEIVTNTTALHTLTCDKNPQEC